MSAAIELHDYQKAWFMDRARFKIGMFARQTGNVGLDADQVQRLRQRTHDGWHVADQQLDLQVGQRGLDGGQQQHVTRLQQSASQHDRTFATADYRALLP